MDEERLSRGRELVRQLADPGDDRGCGNAGAGEAVPALRDRERLQPAVGGCDELEDALVVGVDELGNPVARQSRLKGDDRRVDADLVEEAHTCLQRVRLEPGCERPLAEDELVAVDARRAAPPAKRRDELLGPQVLVDVKGGHRRARTPIRGGRGL